MEKYETPKIDVIELMAEDVIKTSDGVNTPTVEEDDPIWDLNH